MTRKTCKLLSLILAFAMILTTFPIGIHVSATGAPGTVADLTTKYNPEDPTTALSEAVADSNLIAVQGSNAVSVTKYDSSTGYLTDQARVDAALSSNNPYITSDKTKWVFGDRDPTFANSGSASDKAIHAASEFVVVDTTSSIFLGENVTKVLALNSEKNFTPAIPDLYSFSIDKPAIIYVAAGGVFDSNFVTANGWRKESGLAVNRASNSVIQNTSGDNLWYSIPNGTGSMGTIYSKHYEAGTVNIPSRGATYGQGMEIFIVWDECNPVIKVNGLAVGGIAVLNFSQTNMTYNVTLPAGTAVGSIAAMVAADASSGTVSVTQADALPGVATVVVTAGDLSSSVTYNLYLTVASPTLVVHSAAVPQADSGVRANSGGDTNGAASITNINYPVNTPSQNGAATRWAYMRFDLTPYATPIVSAKLTFAAQMKYQTGTGLPTSDMRTRVPYGIVEAYPVDETVTYKSQSVSWLEGSGTFYGTQPSDASSQPYLCWNLKPVISAGMGRIASVSRIAYSTSAYSQYQMDLTSYLRARQAAGATTATILLRAPLYIFSSTLDTNTVQVEVGMKENATAANRPSLAVSTDTADTVIQNNNAAVSYLTTGNAGATGELNLKFGQFDPSNTEEQTFEVATSELPLKINAYMADANGKIALNGGAQVTASTTTTINTSDFTLAGNQKVKTFTIETTAQDGITTRTYHVKLTLPKSNSTKLSSLNYSYSGLQNTFGSVGPWALADSSGTYNVSVGSSVTSVTLDAISADNGTVIYEGGSPTVMVPGSKAVTVTAEDGVTVGTYTVNFIQEVPSQTITNIVKRNTSTTPVATLGTNLQLTGTQASDPEQIYCDRTNVAYYAGTSSVFLGADYIKTSKGDSDAASGPPAYWGSSNLDWYSFQVHNDATVYYASPIGAVWQNGLDRGWTPVAGLSIVTTNGTRTNLYRKHVQAGESIIVPNLGGNLASGPYNTDVVLVVYAKKKITGLTLNTPTNLNQKLDSITPVSFTATPTPSENVDVAQIEWYVNDVKQSAVGATFTYTPAAVGDYTVSVKVADNLEAIGDSKTITVTEAPNYGDISGDGQVDISDVIMAAEIAVGSTNYSAAQIARANVSDKNDATVDISDVVLIAERAVGGTELFPVEK